MLNLIVSLVLFLFVSPIWQSPETAKDHLKRGIAYLQAGELDAALAAATRAIELDPKLVGAYQLRFMVTNQKSPQADNSHDSDMIIRLAPSAPWTAVCYVYRGNERAFKLDWNGAVEDITAAIRIDPSNGDWYNVRAFVHLYRNDLLQARADYEKSLLLKPDLPSPYVRRAHLRYQNLDFAGALEDLSKAIEWKPAYANGYAYRGLVFGLQGNIDWCLQDLKRAFSLRPISISDQVPAVDFDAPFGGLKVFIEHHPTYARGYEVRGIFNLIQHKQAEAATDFNKALELQPTLKPEIDRILAQLRD